MIAQTGIIAEIGDDWSGIPVYAMAWVFTPVNELIHGASWLATYDKRSSYEGAFLSHYGAIDQGASKAIINGNFTTTLMSQRPVLYEIRIS